MEIRPATADDYDDYARLMPELGVDDPVPTRDRFAAELRARTLVASQDAAVVGYALFDVLAERRYIRNLVSDPARRRHGIGLALKEAMRRRFVAAGARAWCLNASCRGCGAPESRGLKRVQFPFSLGTVVAVSRLSAQMTFASPVDHLVGRPLRVAAVPIPTRTHDARRRAA
jgi:GNAT superfamily N-acetyltransferase